MLNSELRKGTSPVAASTFGTSVFIRLRDKMRPDRRNIVADLKLEGYQLIKINEDILLYLSEGTRQHVITAFREYLLKMSRGGKNMRSSPIQQLPALLLIRKPASRQVDG